MTRNYRPYILTDQDTNWSDTIMCTIYENVYSLTFIIAKNWCFVENSQKSYYIRVAGYYVKCVS